MINITKLIINATKEHNQIKANIYKEVKTSFINYTTSKNAKPLTESIQISIIQKLKKQLDDTIPILINHNHVKLASEYKKQSDYLEELLPELPTTDEIEKYIINTYPEGIYKKDMGKVIKELKEKFLGIDGKTLSNLVKTQLI